MTQDERWLTRYNEVVGFIKANHRRRDRGDRSASRGGMRMQVELLKAA